VCYDAPSKSYLLVTGATCSGGEAVPASENNPATFSPNPIVFSQLTGDATAGTVTVTENAGPKTITINHEGTILW